MADTIPFIYSYDPTRTLPLQNIFNCWPAAATPHLPERHARARLSGHLLEFLQLRSFNRRTSVSQSSMGPRSSGEVAQQHASAWSNQRFMNSFLCLNLLSAKRQCYVHICGFNDPKLNDGRGWRCPWMAGGKAVAEARAVTAVPVRSSAWLGIAGVGSS